MTYSHALRAATAALAFALVVSSCASSATTETAPAAVSQATRPPASATTTPAATVAALSPAATPSPTPVASATVVVPTPTTVPQPAAITPVPQPTPVPRATSVTLAFRAANLAFDKTSARVPAGATVTATLQNDDTGIDHNLTFSLPGLAHGETCKGPCTRTQTFTASAAGSYYFLCTLHDMAGTFIVEP